jgi:hypothetical protein
MAFISAVRVEHDYTAIEPDELTMKKGDIIRNVKKKDGGWWEGVLGKRKGFFPGNLVMVSLQFSMKYM